MADARQKRYQERAPEPQRAPTGEVPFYGGLADKLQGFAGQAMHIANRQISEDVDAEAARLHADAYDNIERLATQYEMDPEGFKKVANGWAEGALSGTYPENKARLGAYFQTTVSSRYNALLEAQGKRLEDKYRADFVAGTNSLITDAGYLARTGRFGELETNRQAFVDTVDAATGKTIGDGEPTQKAYIDPVKGVEFIADYDRSIAKNSLRYEFDQRANKQQFVDELRNRTVKGLAVEERDGMVREFEAELAHREARANEAKRAAHEEFLFQRARVGDEVKEVVALLEAGIAVPRGRVVQAREDAAKQGFPDFEEAVSSADREYAAISQYVKMPTDEALAALSVPPDTVDQAQFIARATKAVLLQAEKRKEDPVAAAEDVGFKFSGIDYTDPATWSRRNQEAARAGKRLGIADMPRLKDAEVAAVANYMEVLPAASQVELLTSAYVGLGEEQFRKFTQTLSKKGAGALAVAGNVGAQGDWNTAMGILEGAHVEASVAKAAMTTGGAANAPLLATRDAFGNIYAANPKDGAAAEQAAKQLYFKLARDNKTTTFDEDLYADAASRVIAGERFTLRGNDAVAPKGWRAEDVINWLHGGLTAEDIDAAGGVQGFASSTDALELIRTTGSLVTVAPGRYEVQVERPDRPSGRGPLLRADDETQTLVLSLPGEKPPPETWGQLLDRSARGAGTVPGY